jgi:hypothetical protein
MEQVLLRNAGISSLSTSVRIIVGDMISEEGFDQSDLIGSTHTQNKPLIVVRSAMTDVFYLNQIKPMLYEHYPFGGVANYSREEDQSIIPDWAIIRRDAYSYGTTNLFPWVHYLTSIYYQDFQDARRQVQANATAQATYGHLFIGNFPWLPRGADYDLLFSYTLPNGVVADSSVVKTFVVP